MNRLWILWLALTLDGRRRVLLLAALAALCGICWTVKENYPFSHYPMYGDPNAVSGYYHLADVDALPLAVEKLTGKSAPKLGKILRGSAERKAKALGLRSAARLGRADWDVICVETLGYLRQQAGVLKQTLPDRLCIMYTEIRFVDGRVVESPKVFYRES
jgi:hypothetical protein